MAIEVIQLWAQARLKEKLINVDKIPRLADKKDQRHDTQMSVMELSEVYVTFSTFGS